jgi:hypothetical protein
LVKIPDFPINSSNSSLEAIVLSYEPQPLAKSLHFPFNNSHDRHYNQFVDNGDSHNEQELQITRKLEENISVWAYLFLPSRQHPIFDRSLQDIEINGKMVTTNYKFR